MEEKPQHNYVEGDKVDEPEVDWDDDLEDKRRITQVFEPYKDEPGSSTSRKSLALTETTEINIESDGPHTPTDVVSRGASPALIDTTEPEATNELQSILSQQYPPTPSSASIRSRRQSYSFSRKPTPEPDLPFDFNRFQDQLRSKSAEPVAKYMKSFLHEFSKRQWTNTEQQKIVRDFLDFIRGKMLVYEPFKSASETEFDNAHEGMEKLIMNRLYPDLFPPSIVAKVGKTVAHRMGHGEDLDSDRILADKVRIYSWVKESHLDIPTGPLNDRFLALAGIEIYKLDQYRAPRDKIICVLNCCKVIFGLLRNAGSDESADKFIPLLILTLLRANVQNLCSHVSFIQRFRNPEKLFGEAGYYLSSLQGAINFIEALDRQSLTISDAEYEEMVEQSVQRIKLEASVVPPSPMTPVGPTPQRGGLQLPSKDLVFEKATGLLNIAKPSLSAVGRLFSQEGSTTGDDGADHDLREGLKRSLQETSGASPSSWGTSSSRPLQSRSYIESGAFGAYESPEDTNRPKLPSRRPTATPSTSAQLSSSAPVGEYVTPTNGGNYGQSLQQSDGLALNRPRNASNARVEISEAEANAAKLKERQETLTTLSAMFENVEIGVIEMVLDEKRGKVGASIDALLEIGGA